MSKSTYQTSQKDIQQAAVFCVVMPICEAALQDPDRAISHLLTRQPATSLPAGLSYSRAGSLSGCCQPGVCQAGRTDPTHGKRLSHFGEQSRKSSQTPEKKYSPKAQTPEKKQFGNFAEQSARRPTCFSCSSLCSEPARQF